MKNGSMRQFALLAAVFPAVGAVDVSGRIVPDEIENFKKPTKEELALGIGLKVDGVFVTESEFGHGAYAKRFFKQGELIEAGYGVPFPPGTIDGNWWEMVFTWAHDNPPSPDGNSRKHLDWVQHKNQKGGIYEQQWAMASGPAAFYNTAHNGANTEMTRYFEDGYYTIHAACDIMPGDPLLHKYKSINWRDIFVRNLPDTGEDFVFSPAFLPQLGNFIAVDVQFYLRLLPEAVKNAMESANYYASDKLQPIWDVMGGKFDSKTFAPESQSQQNKDWLDTVNAINQVDCSNIYIKESVDKPDPQTIQSAQLKMTSHVMRERHAFAKRPFKVGEQIERGLLRVAPSETVQVTFPDYATCEKGLFAPGGITSENNIFATEVDFEKELGLSVGGLRHYEHRKVVAAGWKVSGVALFGKEAKPARQAIEEMRQGKPTKELAKTEDETPPSPREATERANERSVVMTCAQAFDLLIDQEGILEGANTLQHDLHLDAELLEYKDNAEKKRQSAKKFAISAGYTLLRVEVPEKVELEGKSSKPSGNILFDAGSEIPARSLSTFLKSRLDDTDQVEFVFLDKRVRVHILIDVDGQYVGKLDNLRDPSQPSLWEFPEFINTNSGKEQLAFGTMSGLAMFVNIDESKANARLVSQYDDKSADPHGRFQKGWFKLEATKPIGKDDEIFVRRKKAESLFAHEDLDSKVSSKQAEEPLEGRSRFDRVRDACSEHRIIVGGAVVALALAVFLPKYLSQSN